MEQNFYEPEGHFDSDADVSIKKWKSISTLPTDSENDDCGFDCNICLDSAHEPVVTLCGHLYCWTCIYKWLQVPTTSDKPSHMKGTCPVCKADITHALLVPLYGRGTSHSDSEGKKPQLGQVVPRRPSPELNTLMTNILSASLPRRQLDPNYLERHSQPVHDQYYPSHGGYVANSESSYLEPSHGAYAANSESSYLGAATMTTLSHPTIGMVGEFVFARIFGSSDTNMFSYPYMNSYPPSSPRMRRQEVQLDKSLNRVTIFLFCCFILCLLLF